MKKIFLITTFLLLGTINSFSQTEIFDKLEDIDDVTSVLVTKDAFELLKKFPDAKSEDMKVFNIVKGLEELKVFSTENMSVAKDMEKMVNQIIKEGKLTKLVRVKQKKSRVKIYVKTSKNKDIVNEVLMFVKSLANSSNSSSTIILLVGEINMNELAKIGNNYEKKK